jgi:hypothetical protein
MTVAHRDQQGRERRIHAPRLSPAAAILLAEGRHVPMEPHYRKLAAIVFRFE